MPPNPFPADSSNSDQIDEFEMAPRFSPSPSLSPSLSLSLSLSPQNGMQNDMTFHNELVPQHRLSLQNVLNQHQHQQSPVPTDLPFPIHPSLSQTKNFEWNSGVDHTEIGKQFPKLSSMDRNSPLAFNDKMPPSPFGYPPLNATENLQNQVNHAGSILDNPYPSPREGNMPNETFDALYGRDPMNDEWWMNVDVEWM